MMQTIFVRGLTIGAGIPKICVPVTGNGEAEILAEASAPAMGLADLVEWRADHFRDHQEPKAVRRVLGGLREVLGDKPLLFTFRSEREGGAARFTPEAYEGLLTEAAGSGLADLVDLELFSGEDCVHRVLAAAHAAGTGVVMSSHDFDGTPGEEEILQRLRRMQDLGADILKIAVMPRSDADVLTLMSATRRMRDEYALRPLITMAMSARGTVSRVSGEFFGSAVTFGAAAKASAPGQMDVQSLRTVLELLHRAQISPS